MPYPALSWQYDNIYLFSFLSFHFLATHNKVTTQMPLIDAHLIKMHSSQKPRISTPAHFLLWSGLGKFGSMPEKPVYVRLFKESL